MMLFFNTETQITVSHEEFDCIYEHVFDGFDNTTNSVFFTTPSDHTRRLEILKKQESNIKLNIVDPNVIVQLPNFPTHIGFNTFDGMIDILSKLEIIDIGIINAMSNAIGDHLIGMQAFDYFRNKLIETFPDKEIRFTLYQLNPYRISSITSQWKTKFNHLYMLPNRVSRLCEHNCFIDLGSLLIKKNFDKLPMMDFFLEALSIDYNTVPKEAKRIKYQVNPETQRDLKEVFVVLRSLKRPILLFHPNSSSLIRQMDIINAKRILNDIINKSDYFVISAEYFDFQHPRFMSLHKYSQNLDQFAAIISQVDAILTVDTSTYHLADAFNTPTVVLFSSISPEYRIKYYPHVRGIMLEEKDGLLYGKHKSILTSETLLAEIDYLVSLWEKVDVSQVLELLEDAKIAAF